MYALTGGLAPLMPATDASQLKKRPPTDEKVFDFFALFTCLCIFLEVLVVMYETGKFFMLSATLLNWFTILFTVIYIYTHTVHRYVHAKRMNRQTNCYWFLLQTKTIVSNLLVEMITWL